MITKQFTLYLENRPGVLAKLTRALAEKKVNIEGISVAESTDVAIVQIVADDATRARKALELAKVAYTMQDVAVIFIDNKPGGLFKVASKLARDKVNINYIYGTACDSDCGCRCCVIVGADNLKRVEAAWKSKRK